MNGANIVQGAEISEGIDLFNQSQSHLMSQDSSPIRADQTTPIHQAQTTGAVAPGFKAETDMQQYG